MLLFMHPLVGIVVLVSIACSANVIVVIGNGGLALVYNKEIG